MKIDLKKKGIRNPFRNADMRQIFEGYVNLFYAGELRNADGSHNHGGSARSTFWKGYEGIPNLLVTKDSQCYATYRAGQAVKKAEEK